MNTVFAGPPYPYAVTDVCPAGGITVEFGLDTDRDGVLAQPDEVLGYFEVCDGATGPTGPRGPSGPRGPTGAMGPTGPDGLTTVFANPPYPHDVTSNCPDGGITIPYGLDEDGDGMLTYPDEVRGSFDVCDGPEGPSGPRGEVGEAGPMGETGPVGAMGELGPTGPQGPMGETGVGTAGRPATTRITRFDEGQSALCPRGGSLIEVGADNNDNGSLDDDEVTDSDTVCDGLHAQQQVFALEPIERGGACGAQKGVLILSGLDDGAEGTNNGILDDDEVDVSHALCVEGADVNVESGCNITSNNGSSRTAAWLLAAFAALMLRRTTRQRRQAKPTHQ